MPPAETGYFCGKSVLILSPQPWEHIHLSKHHYARELASRGNRVYFVDPPVPNQKPSIRASDFDGIWVINYPQLAPNLVRFHFRWLYRHFVKLNIRRITRLLPSPPDVVWCFDFNLFPDLRDFRAEKTIYHPVDPVSLDYQLHPGHSADLVLTVSDSVQQAFEAAGVTCHFLDHGLSPAFTELANSPGHSEPNEIPQIGYAGNLDRQPFDQELILNIVEAYPACRFHFWGPYSDTDFSRRLAAFPNVEMYGKVSADILARAMKTLDICLLCYRFRPGEYDLSNSHKLIEYLSTGVSVVSSPVSRYRDEEHDLVYMADDQTREAFRKSLDHVLANLVSCNSPTRQARRKAFALQHSYSGNLLKIEQLLTRTPQV